jgi:amino acid transporter
MVAVAMVVGAGIFRSPAEIAANADSATWFFAAWLVGGAITLAGALCFGELATMLPSAGGDYHFLKTTYGRRIAFLFAWARFAIINTGSLALLGFVFGDYVNAIWSLGPHGSSWYAVGAIVALTALNLKGTYRGMGADYTMTGVLVVGLLIIFAAGVVLAAAGAPPLVPDAEPPPGFPATFGLALLFVLFAFSGWSEISTLSAEVRDARRGMVKALVTAITTITVLYLLVNWALWRGLGIEGLAGSRTPASDLIGLAFGAHAGLITAVAVAMATLTSIHATIIVGARTTYACASDWPVLARIGQWDDRLGIPVRAMLAQSAVALMLVGLGTWTRNGFATMIDYTSPVFWLFLSLSGFAVILLRIRRPDLPRPFRVPLYPVLPLVFVAACLFVFWSSVQYVRLGAMAGVGVLVLGGLVMAWLGRAGSTEAAAR